MHQANKPKRITSWHVIGAQLSHFRKAARMTQPMLAERVGVHEDTIGSVEQGRRPLKLDLAETMDEVLGTKGALAVAVAKVPEREKLPAFVQDLVEHEEEALTLLSYENQVVPGLLQTEPYARATFDSLYPPLENDQTEEWVSGRISRQKLLERENPRPMLNFILEEVALHRPIGGPKTLSAQLRHLRSCAELPFLGLQIMPTARCPHASLDGPLVLLETPEHEHLAYIEAQRISFLVDDPDEVSGYQQKYGMLRSQALTPEETKSLLDDLLGEP
ncbi:DNA-binding transcriptional regulator, XRE-family HTH domain [Streptomyces sp. 2224.1]|uniref:helix-turn-helix domain-containing protein n=1 Tax=unclassified Streptomyces TaxID=2593676 RepID=UPI00088C6A85|nr:MULTISPECIES: helix-turn-helix transcriptional regulator [unclassified Streptomyces]PBC85220.1 DNA-binding XRE family transcriptional regulator [Streptomyces sp. 2321.6]SDR19842.1 DNA-binding transcriptional regulator, XRE-family HTH domain [Streptomyces sp. KS_16]SEB51833.1 DNA-binding transcriptional regulator, XRE-family HTH domain [Streptomyces sp. 2224.1]SED60134.1 DNA-binding transcriptional regulator, XRE-family HTH domain [Streptomyces sp. 2133.1]SEE23738.1 DNA-binding transcription